MAVHVLKTSTIHFFKNRMSTETSEEIKAIRVLPISGQQVDWDEWSKKYQGIAAERGYLKVMLGTERVPDDDERKQKHHARKMNQKGYRNLQLSTSKWAFQLVSLAKTVDLPYGSLAKAWAALTDEYDPSEGEDKIKLLEDFQNKKLLNGKVNITALSTQVMKLNKLSHLIGDD